MELVLMTLETCTTMPQFISEILFVLKSYTEYGITTEALLCRISGVVSM
jgi:hypothetical protein